jgi:hypothetical protein
MKRQKGWWSTVPRARAAFVPWLSKTVSIDMVVPIPSHRTASKKTGVTGTPDVYKSELKTRQKKTNMGRNQWPVKLFWLPYESPEVVFLGLVSSSFLAQKRRQLPLQRHGACVAVDCERPGGPPDRQEKNGSSSVGASPTASDPVGNRCRNEASLRRKAKSVCRLLEVDRGLKRARALPSVIRCGYLRSAVTCSYDDLDVVSQLSVKTAMKNEQRFCDSCRQQLENGELEKWKKERFLPVSVDDNHLRRFARALGRNVPEGWNQGMVWPYIPNGHASAYHGREEGGTWNVEPLVGTCVPGAVVTSGKVRIVTRYSASLSEVLYPLHRSLYATLRRKGWLLCGPPTACKVASLNGRGEYISVDYKSATDNIKTSYTRAAVEVLIQKGVGLRETELWALRTVGNLELDGKPAVRGQPMGSLISFPLLCLVNKTVVDLALEDLLMDGEISFKEWTSHRCLINGDDLLLKSPTHHGGLTFLPRVCWHGGQVGLVVNNEKTMVSERYAEINSTLFSVQEHRVTLEKKTNTGVYRYGKVDDVLGLADQATVSGAGFILVVRNHLESLRRQERKSGRTLPLVKWRALLREAKMCSKLRSALMCHVQVEPAGNLFPIVKKPEGYDLTRLEEDAIISCEVSRIRQQVDLHGWPSLPGVSQCGRMRPAVMSVLGTRTLRAALGWKTPREEDNVLKVLYSAWKNKKTKEMVVRDDASVDGALLEHVCDECGEMALASRLVCEIKAFNKRNAVSRSAPHPQEMGTFVRV